MAITFNTTDGIQGSMSGTGLYAHIVNIFGPKQIPAQTDPVIAAYWIVSYEIIVHKDKSTRDGDSSSWTNQINMRIDNHFKWTAANLDTQPTLPVLYAHLKTELSSISGISSIADVL